MGWTDSFLAYATINSSLTRTLSEEAESPLMFTEFQPAFNNAIMTIFEEDGPIHTRDPQTKPLCEACRKESDNG